MYLCVYASIKSICLVKKSVCAADNLLDCVPACYSASVSVSLSDCLCVLDSLQKLPEVLGSHQVRVQVKACGLSPLDVKVFKLETSSFHTDVLVPCR